MRNIVNVFLLPDKNIQKIIGVPKSKERKYQRKNFNNNSIENNIKNLNNSESNNMNNSDSNNYSESKNNNKFEPDSTSSRYRVEIESM